MPTPKNKKRTPSKWSGLPKDKIPEDTLQTVLGLLKQQAARIDEIGTAFNQNAGAYYEGYQMTEMWSVIQRRVLSDMLRGEVYTVEVEYAQPLRPADLQDQAMHPCVDWQKYKEDYIAMIGLIAALDNLKHVFYKPQVKLATEADLRVIEFGGDVPLVMAAPLTPPVRDARGRLREQAQGGPDRIICPNCKGVAVPTAPGSTEYTCTSCNNGFRSKPF